MDASVLWFVCFAALSVAAAVAGARLNAGPVWRGRLVVICGLVFLGCWGWLVRHPAIAVQIIPAHVLSWIEGVAAVPVFMLVVGAAWGRSELTRQKHIVVGAGIVGVIFFFQGGWWMLQATPSAGFASDVHRGPTYQSQDYSCVPAAAATSLNMLGVYTTEAEMAQLTRTRPGLGATTIRALDGVQQILEGTAYQAELVQPTYDELEGMRTPALTPLQFETTRRHMVTLVHVDSEGVWVADPTNGPVYMTRAEFLGAYRYEVIRFVRR